MSLWVYILECSDQTLYTGVTNDLERRFNEHQSGFNKEAYTYLRRPVRLVYAEQFSDYKLAYDWERKLKKWSAEKKWALIEENWDKLKELSVCQNDSHYLKKFKR